MPDYSHGARYFLDADIRRERRFLGAFCRYSLHAYRYGIRWWMLRDAGLIKIYSFAPPKYFSFPA